MNKYVNGKRFVTGQALQLKGRVEWKRQGHVALPAQAGAQPKHQGNPRDSQGGCTHCIPSDDVSTCSKPCPILMNVFMCVLNVVKGVRLDI